MFPAEVLGSLTLNDRPLLPISVDRQLPHIQLKFGNAASNENIHPGIFSIVDSRASEMIGNLPFWTKTVCVYTCIVIGVAMASIDGYSPIRLSRVVKSDGASDTTAKLPVVYTLRFPYTHCVNNQSMYLKIACRDSVSVNFLTGNPFLYSTRINLCFETKILRCASLDHELGFHLTYKKSKLSTPSPSHVSAILAVPNDNLKATEEISVFVGLPPVR